MNDPQVSIGVRVEPSKLHWGLVKGSKVAPMFLDAGTYEHPKAESDVQALCSYRREVSDICAQWKPGHAWIRIAEHSVGKRSLLMRRCWIEGVVAATLRELGLTVEMGGLVLLNARLLGPRAARTPKKRTKSSNAPAEMSLKAHLTADEFRGLSWAGRQPNQREALLAAACSLGA